METNSVELASRIRTLALKMVHDAKASHIGGALSMADLLAVLYTSILRIKPQQPFWEDRDRFLLSKGHACTSLYSTLALKGFFDVKALSSYCAEDSFFLAHASHKVPGVELSTGSLGHALSVSCGLALAARRKNKEWKIYTLLSDGELDEGSNWEAILFAPHHRLDNMTIIIDYNKIQSLGEIKEVMGLEPLADKFKAFGWSVFEIDGHNHNEIYKALSASSIEKGRPKAIIAHTIKGKGVDFMENKLLWHYKSPDAEQLEMAIKSIER
jgi:transketolase